MSRFPARIPDKTTIDRKHARSQLAQLLAGMTDERLRSHSVDSLAAINRTPKPEIAVMLADARQRRFA